MTRPRWQLVDRVNGGFYHLVSRCVRRAFLCGRDAVTGKNYDHRRGWIEERLLTLSEVFAVAVYGYAVMSNHYHLVVHYQPQLGATWSDEEVVQRWLTLYPPKRAPDHAREGQALLATPEKVAELRSRLCDISWFMRCLNEPIARRANREDGCTGRFWEGRFISKPLADEDAVYTALVYGDLNPIRAGLTQRLDGQEHTSLQRRLEEARRRPGRWQERLGPLRYEGARGVSSLQGSVLRLTLTAYRRLVLWTLGRDQGPDPPWPIPREAWLSRVAAHRRRSRQGDALPRWMAPASELSVPD